MWYESVVNVPHAHTPRWTVASGATALAVDLDTAKTWLNRPLEDDFWDAEMTANIRVAQRAIEHHCQNALTPTTYTATLPQFYDRIRVEKRPFTAVTAFRYVAYGSGEILDVPADSYIALPISQDCGLIERGESTPWPYAARRADAVRLTVTAGYAPGALPEDITQALLMTLASLDKTRGDAEQSGNSNTTVYAMKQSRGGSIVPVEARSLLMPYVYRTVTI